MYALSAQECIDCESNGCTANRTSSDCLNYIKKNRIATNETYPYKGKTGECESLKKSPVEVESFVSMTSQNESSIITQLNNGPIVASIDAS